MCFLISSVHINHGSEHHDLPCCIQTIFLQTMMKPVSGLQVVHYTRSNHSLIFWQSMWLVPPLIKPSPLAATILSPSGSMDDSSPTSSPSESLSPERAGLGGEAGKQQLRRRKKKRKGRDEMYNFFDSQKNDVSQIDVHGVQDKGRQEVDEDENEEENWEWEIKESGGGGRMKSRKTKTRARLPEEWGAPPQPVSPIPATVAPSWVPPTGSGPYDCNAPNSGFTKVSSTNPTTDSSSRSYEPMCVDDFPVTAKDWQKANEDKGVPIQPEQNLTLQASAANKTSVAGNVSASLALMTGDNLSPVSQTFSFLDSVLQTPPGSTPDSQTATPVVNTPSLSTQAEVPAPVLRTSPVSSLSIAETQRSMTSAESSLNVGTKIVAPSDTSKFSPITPRTTAATPAVDNISAAAAEPAASVFTATSTNPLGCPAAQMKSEVAHPSSSDTLTKAVATPFTPSTATPPPSTTPAAPLSRPAHSEHQESSSPLLPPLEGWWTTGIMNNRVNLTKSQRMLG